MFKITLTDTGLLSYKEAWQHFKTVELWAERHCPSFVRCEQMDVSDFSLVNDIVAIYYFKDEKDAVLFKLRWV